MKQQHARTQKPKIADRPTAALYPARIGLSW